MLGTLIRDCGIHDFVDALSMSYLLGDSVNEQ